MRTDTGLLEQVFALQDEPHYFVVRSVHKKAPLTLLWTTRRMAASLPAKEMRGVKKA